MHAYIQLNIEVFDFATIRASDKGLSWSEMMRHLTEIPVDMEDLSLLQALMFGKDF